MEVHVILVQNPNSELEAFLCTSCESVYRLETKEMRRIQQAWREIYAFNVKKSTGKWIYRGIDWHTFSHSFSPSLSGARAENEFSHLIDREFLLFSSTEGIPGYHCSVTHSVGKMQFNILLSCCPYLADVFISSPEYEWTMVYTHEHAIGIGPFFSRREWQEFAVDILQ